jgi:hypothetical protein
MSARVEAAEEALNRVHKFLTWFDNRSDDIATGFPSGPSLYVADLRSLIAAVEVSTAVIEQLEATYPSGKLWADKHRDALAAVFKGDDA